jgi:hypothetical protein
MKASQPVEESMPNHPETALFLCPNCFSPDTVSGNCPMCGHEKLECRPGVPGDPCRMPLLDKSGQVLSRAPRWWLARCVPALMESLEHGS